MSDILERLRASVTQCRAVDRSELLEQAAAEIERLRQQRNHWISTARAFDEHMATLRVMLMEMPGVRFGAAAICETAPLCSDPSAYTSGIPASGESKFSLTDAERASVTRAIETLEGVEYIDAFCSENDATAAAILRGMLERLK